MPAKRNPKKSRKQSPPQGTPPNLDALTVRPPAVVLPTEPVASAVSPDTVSPIVAAPTVPPSADAPTVSPVITAGAPAGSVSLPESPEIPARPSASATPSRSGPPAERQARFNGRSQRAGQTRFYAFRRS
nr:hypothetical protein [Micromonospora purpureochromogenes]